LRKATVELSPAEFGRWDRIPDQKFDRNNWTAVIDPVFFNALQLKAGKSAAQAIYEIVTNPDAWRIDCDFTVQIANLYAMAMILGPTQFNALGGPNFTLRPRDSSGLKTVEHYARDEFATGYSELYPFMSNPGPWRVAEKYDAKAAATSEPPVSGFSFAPGPPLTATTEQLLQRAPPGSRVRWTNLWVHTNESSRHDNAVKLKDDLYAVGGLRDGALGNEYTRSELETRMARDGSNDDITKRMLIDEIEVFGMHG
jgi:hypothetical protein